MHSSLIDVLGWTAIFIGLFFLFRYLQKRKENKGKDK